MSRACAGLLHREQIPTLELWEYGGPDPIDICVGIDHEKTGAHMANAMIALGYKKPGFVGLNIGYDLRSDKRLNGIRRAYREAGLGDVQTARSDRSDNFRAGFDGMKQLIENNSNMPDIVFFLSDYFAFAGMMACQEMGLSVPEDIGIIGFNSLPLNNILPRRITTAKTQRHDMG